MDNNLATSVSLIGRLGRDPGDASAWEQFDLELLEEAQRRVRLRVEPHTWEVFRLLTFEALPGAEAAARVGMKVSAAYVAKSKVQKMLQEELGRLEAAG